MDFRILGPLDVVDGDRVMQVRGARQRAVLGMLLINANRVVSADRLIDGVWGDCPPTSGAAALQMRVSQLRRALSTLRGQTQDEEGPLVTVPGGYVMRVDADDVDALRFERLLAEGRTLAADGDPASASVHMRGARALWRGNALSDFAFEPFAQAEIARLEELRLVLAEEWLAVELALGRHAVVVPDVEALVAAHPLRERLRALLMIALYRSDRQADALAAYREARAYLSRELAVEPGATLQRLEQQVLRHAPDLELQVPGSDGAVRPVTASVEPSRKPITVVCTSVRVAVDRSGAPPADVDPELRSRWLDRCLAVEAEAFEQQGALVRRLPGAVLATFGLPTVREDDAVRAVRAAVGVHEKVHELAGELAHGRGLPLQARSGIATGDVLMRDYAAAEAWDAGEPAEMALELSTRADPGEVLIADSTEPLIRHAAVLTRRATSPASTAWRVGGLTAVHSGRVVRRDAPMVGRRRELTELARTVERAAAEGVVHTCTIAGAAGVGKSRLVQEFTETAGKAATVVTGSCAPYGEIATFSPLRQVVEQLAAGRSLADVVRGTPHADIVARLVAAAVGLGEATGAGDVSWAIGRFFEAASRDRPLVVVLEDMHWASPTLLELMEFLSSWQRPAAVALICLARPELHLERPGWVHLPRSTHVELSPLDPREAEILLGHLAGSHQPPAEVRQRLARAAEGNPLFLEQLLAMITENPGLDVEADLPPTVAALLAARLDQLGPGERAVIERAAVVGRAFHRDAVAALLPVHARSTVDRHLAALVTRDLLSVLQRHTAATHTFRHGLIHAAAYRSGATGAHAELHESLAAWLEGTGGATDEVVGHHLERAVECQLALRGRADHIRELAGRAAQRLRLAGEQAYRRGDMPASATLLERARRLPTGDDVRDLELMPSLGQALFEVGQLHRAETVLTEAVTRADGLHQPKVRWEAAVTLMHLTMYLRPEALRPEALLRSATEAAGELERLGDDVGVARALMFTSDLQWVLGRAVATQEAAERGLAFARRSRSRREEAWCRGQLGFALLNGPVPVGMGLRRCRDMLIETRGDPVAQANLLMFVAVHEAMARDFPDALDHAAAGRAATRELGLRWQTGIHALLSSQVCCLSGNPVEAESLLRTALATFEETEDRWDAATARLDLQRALYEQGRYDDARAAVASIDQPPVADAESTIKRCGVPALLLARERRFADAERVVREGIAFAGRTDLLAWKADLLMDLGEVLELAGRPDEAFHAVTRALRRYAGKGHAVGAARARARLGSLASRRRPVDADAGPHPARPR